MRRPKQEERIVSQNRPIEIVTRFSFLSSSMKSILNLFGFRWFAVWTSQKRSPSHDQLNECGERDDERRALTRGMLSKEAQQHHWGQKSRCHCPLARTSSPFSKP